MMLRIVSVAPPASDRRARCCFLRHFQCRFSTSLSTHSESSLYFYNQAVDPPPRACGAPRWRRAPVAPAAAAARAAAVVAAAASRGSPRSPTPVVRPCARPTPRCRHRSQSCCGSGDGGVKGVYENVHVPESAVDHDVGYCHCSAVDLTFL